VPVPTDSGTTHITWCHYQICN